MPKGDQLVLMGDLNARVGRDANSWRGVIGRQGEETLNGNGRRLLDLCAVNELVILNTLYQHKEIHKFTWESKGRGLKSIIDYFIVRRALRPGVTDVRVIRGAEVGSDHHLLLMKLRLKVQRPKRHTEAGKCRLKVHRLESREAKVKYQQELRRLQWQMKDMYGGEDVERAWKQFRLAVIGGAERVVGRSRNRQQKKATTWWSEEVRAVIKSKKNLYKKALNAKTTEAWEEYKKANKEAKKVVREAKERDWIRWGEQLQRNFVENKRAFWKKVKAKGAIGINVGIECKDGTLLTEKDEIMCRWREHFSELLGSEQEEEGVIGEGMSRRVIEDGSELLAEITKEEIRRCVGKLKKRKAEGVCGISGELLKAGGEVVIEWLSSIYNMVWRTGAVPEDWQRAIIVPIHKKSSRRKCGNYRGSSLLSIPGKVFARILSDRVKQLTYNRLLEEQAGFRSGRGCTDHIFVIRQLVEKH